MKYKDRKIVIKREKLKYNDEEFIEKKLKYKMTIQESKKRYNRKRSKNYEYSEEI